MDTVMRLQNPILMWLSNFQINFFTLFHGKFVGEDEFGTKYYKEKRPANPKRERRWAIHYGEPEATKVPPEWFGWLHHMFNKPLNKQSQFHKDWQKKHTPNMTGTKDAYYPPGHTYKGTKREKATGDYKAWSP